MTNVCKENRIEKITKETKIKKCIFLVVLPLEVEDLRVLHALLQLVHHRLGLDHSQGTMVAFL